MRLLWAYERPLGWENCHRELMTLRTSTDSAAGGYNCLLYVALNVKGVH